MAIEPMTGFELQQWRRGRRLSQTRLAQLLAVRQATVSEWENGAVMRNGVMLRLAIIGLEKVLPTAAPQRRRVRA